MLVVPLFECQHAKNAWTPTTLREARVRRNTTPENTAMDRWASGSGGFPLAESTRRPETAAAARALC